MLAQVKKTGRRRCRRAPRRLVERPRLRRRRSKARARPPKTSRRLTRRKPKPPKSEARQPEAQSPTEPPSRSLPSPTRPLRPRRRCDGGEIRIRALETLWGEGRLSPGSFALDTHLIDAALELADRPGAIGFIGADASLLNAFAAQSDRKPIATEWRAACVSRLNELVANADVTVGEVDRPRGFQDGSLPAIVSVEAFAYADHKAGLVGRVFRALDAGGRWVFLDTTRRTKKTPPQAFASAWAEPQLSTNDEIEELLTLAGFKTIRRVSVADLVLASAKQGYANLAQVIESAASSGLSRVAKAHCSCRNSPGKRRAGAPACAHSKAARSR